MEAIKCGSCGASEWIEKDGLRKCAYCGTVYHLDENEKGSKQSNIALNDDVQRLLEKCKNEPRNAKKYANLILDIDPSNSEAKKYL